MFQQRSLPLVSSFEYDFFFFIFFALVLFVSDSHIEFHFYFRCDILNESLALFISPRLLCSLVDVDFIYCPIERIFFLPSSSSCLFVFRRCAFA